MASREHLYFGAVLITGCTDLVPGFHLLFKSRDVGSDAAWLCISVCVASLRSFSCLDTHEIKKKENDSGYRSKYLVNPRAYCVYSSCGRPCGS